MASTGRLADLPCVSIAVRRQEYSRTERTSEISPTRMFLDSIRGRARSCTTVRRRSVRGAWPVRDVMIYRGPSGRIRPKIHVACTGYRGKNAQILPEEVRLPQIVLY